MGLLLMTRFTLLEVVRRRLFLAIVILSVLLLGTFALLLHVAIDVILSNNTSNQPTQIIVLSMGVLITILASWMVYLLSSVLTVVLTANMISGEVEAGTFAVIVPKPLRRVEIVLGKWLGYGLIVLAYTAFLFLSFLGVIYLETGYFPPQVLFALMTLESGMLTLLGLTTVGSAFVPTIVNGVIALVLFVSGPTTSIVQFIVQVVAQTQSPTMQNITTVVSLIIPTDVLWHGTSYYLLPTLNIAALLGISSTTFNTPFTSAVPVQGAFIVWAILYSLVLPLLAVVRFQFRDL